MTSPRRPSPLAAQLVFNVLTDAHGPVAATTTVRRSLQGTQRRYAARYTRVVLDRFQWLRAQGAVRRTVTPRGAVSFECTVAATPQSCRDAVATGRPTATGGAGSTI